MAGNGRYGGGKAGPEHRYSRPAVDTDQFEDAKRGADARSSDQGEAGYQEAAMVNTIGVPRGKIMGACYPDDKWRQGF